MNIAKAALVVAVFAVLFGVAGLAMAGYSLLQSRELTQQLSETQSAVQTLAATNQDLSDQLQKLRTGGLLAAGGKGAAATAKVDPELANTLHGIEGRLNDLDGGGEAHFGIKWQVSQLQLDLTRLDSKMDDLARRH